MTTPGSRWRHTMSYMASEAVGCQTRHGTPARLPCLHQNHNGLPAWFISTVKNTFSMLENCVMPHSVMKEYDLAKICRANTNLNVLGHHCLWVQQYILGCQALTYVRKYRSYLMPGGVVKKYVWGVYGHFTFWPFHPEEARRATKVKREGSANTLSHIASQFSCHGNWYSACATKFKSKKGPFRFRLVLWKSTLQTKMLHHYFHSLSTDHTLHTVHSLSELEFNFAVSFFPCTDCERGSLTPCKLYIVQRSDKLNLNALDTGHSVHSTWNINICFEAWPLLREPQRPHIITRMPRARPYDAHCESRLY